MFKKLIKVVFLLLILLGYGCSNTLNIEVESEVPTPLATQIPLNLGIYYSENFQNFVFKESSDAREDWTIDNRISRISMFNEVLPSMFVTVNKINNMSSPDSIIDVILEPEVLEMQVALPEETHTDMYEAWLKYGIKMYDPNGELITQWQITGYGKSHTEMFRNKENGLTTAINLALRDIGAKLVLDFSRSPGVRNWLVSKIDCSKYSDLC